MATRKVFIDDFKTELSFQIVEDPKYLRIWLHRTDDVDNDMNIHLSPNDAIEFISELNRIRKQLV